MKPIRTVTRRRLLQTGTAATIGLPWLTSLAGSSVAHANALTPAGLPKRLLIFFKGNGVFADSWFPKAGATPQDFTFSDSTAPLEPYKSKLLFLDGIDNRVIVEQPKSPGEDHNKGAGSILTGWELNDGDILGADQSSRGGYGKGPSIDQLIAQQIGADSPILSLQVGAHSNIGNVLSRPINYEGNDKPIQSQHDPSVVFDQVFGRNLTPNGDADQLRERRRSLLDFVGRRYDTVAQDVSQLDRQRLDEHGQRLRDLEKRVTQAFSADCAAPGAPPALNANDQSNMTQIIELQRDLLVQAFSCNLTRVGTLMVGNGANQLNFTGVDDFGNDHVLAHAEHGDQSGAVGKRFQRHRWYMQHLHDILAALDAVPEGDGTLLDSTLVLFCSENSNGWHQHTRHPFLLAGSLGGHFNTGRLLHYQQASHVDLLSAILGAYGVDGSNFGNPAFRGAPLTDLLA